MGKLVYGVTQTPQVYLDHQVYERGGNLHLTWDAVEELFPSGLLDDMFAAYSGYVRRLALEEAAWSETSAPHIQSTLFSRYAPVKDAAADLPPGGAGEITTALLRHPLVADAVVVKAPGWEMISSDTWCQSKPAMMRWETPARHPGLQVR